MIQHQVLGDILFYMLYAGLLVAALIACCYLLFRRGNAFAPDIVTSLRLRRWSAVLFASLVLSHVWRLLSCQFHLVGNQFAGEAVCFCFGYNF